MTEALIVVRCIAAVCIFAASIVVIVASAYVAWMLHQVGKECPRGRAMTEQESDDYFRSRRAQAKTDFLLAWEGDGKPVGAIFGRPIPEVMRYRFIFRADWDPDSDRRSYIEDTEMGDEVGGKELYRRAFGEEPGRWHPGLHKGEGGV